MTRVPTLDSAKVDSDEDGFHLFLTDDEGERHHFRLPLDAGLALDAALAPVREHAAEGARELELYLAASPAERAFVLGHPVDDSDGPF